ncbi:hypothetical protein SFRURICE_018552 [Spodoptera frugiperda]|nr:hypothetical protein SFRURICE_018552 [Spodoptera frugiperda]
MKIMNHEAYHSPAVDLSGLLAPRFVRNATISRDLGVESVDDFVQRLSTNMFERASKSQHDHLRALAPYHRRPPDGYGATRPGRPDRPT